jgi:hypothetical protein
MTTDSLLETLSLDNWRGPFSPGDQARAIAALEAGRIVFLPRLSFTVLEQEQGLLSPDVASGERKNISFDAGSKRLGGSAAEGETATALAGMLGRFSDLAAGLVRGLIPAYDNSLEPARASFRPVEIKGRASSVRHDDSLLHVDAFPTRPLRGRRILRLFSNISPAASSRSWRVGEPFPDFARRFLPKVKSGVPGHAWALSMLGLTKGRRSAYDEMMLSLHDAAKLDAAWQKNGEQTAVEFPAGSTWIVFTDQVLHAAMAGSCAVEQTFHVPVEAMAHPEWSPLRVLEQVTGRRLVS